MHAISVIVPTLNEVDNIEMLVERIAANFENTDITYEILFIDDHSTDGTQNAVVGMMEKYPVRIMGKRGERGKAHSLLEGFAAARYETLCMIDADLQYPPEAIVPMYKLMQTSKTDIVLTNRQDNATSALRKLTSAGFNFVFTKMLFGFDYDSQSGLKLFKRKVLDDITLTPTPWSFDLEFIVRALEQNYKIISYDINFAERYSGVAKIQVSKVAVELAKASVKLRFTSSSSKVKQAYKENTYQNQRVTNKAMMAGMLAIAVSAVFAVTTVGHARSMELAVAKDTTTGLINTAVDPGATTTPASENSPTATTPTNTAPVATPTPVTTPPMTVEPIAPTPTAVAPVTPKSAPKASSPNPQPSGSAVSPQSKRNVAYSYQPNINGNGYTTPQVLGAATSTPNNSTLATFPNGGQKTTAFSYTNRQPSAAAAYVRPLSITALVILGIGLIVFSAMSILSTLNRPRMNAPGALQS